MIITQRWYSKPPFGWRADPARNIAAGTFDHWPFNDRVGPSTRSAGLQQTAAPFVGGVNWAAGVDGPALSFDGSSGYVGRFGTVDTYSFIQNTLVFTVAGRMKLANTTSRCGILCSNDGNTALKGYFIIYETFGSTAGTRTIRCFATKGTSGTAVGDWHGTDNSINDTNWHTFGLSFSGPSATPAFYVDGLPVGVVVGTAFNALSSGSNANAPVIGAINTTPSLPFGGLMDWLGVWDRALGADEHAALAITPWSMYPAPPWYDDMTTVIGGPSYTPWLFRPEEMS